MVYAWCLTLSDLYVRSWETCRPVLVLLQTLEKAKRKEDYTFQLEDIERPSIILGCSVLQT